MPRPSLLYELQNFRLQASLYEDREKVNHLRSQNPEELEKLRRLADLKCDEVDRANAAISFPKRNLPKTIPDRALVSHGDSNKKEKQTIEPSAAHKAKRPLNQDEEVACNGDSNKRRKPNQDKAGDSEVSSS